MLDQAFPSSRSRIRSGQHSPPRCAAVPGDQNGCPDVRRYGLEPRSRRSTRSAGTSAFERFVAEQSTKPLRTAYLLTGERGGAEDLLQATLLSTANRDAPARQAPEVCLRGVCGQPGSGSSTWYRPPGWPALAGVDRSYIYSQPDLLEEIRRGRTAEPAKLARRPAADRATIASLQARLVSAHDEIARLKAENRTIREQLAIAPGGAWDATLVDRGSR